jgi:C4-dicarboxylate-specific signal transduction histidine kinase
MPRSDTIAASRMGLASQLGLLLIIPIAVAFGIYGFVSHQNRQRVLMAEASAELANHAVLVETAVAGALERGEVELLKQRLARFTQAERILGVACFTVEGAPIFVTDHLKDTTAALAGLSRTAASSKQDVETSLDLQGARVLVRAVNVVPKKGDPVVAIVARDTSYVGGLATTLNRGLAITAICLLAVTFFLVMLLTRATVGRPAAEIVSGAEKIAAGHLGTTVPERGANELARLAAAFNGMSRSLGETRERAERETERCAAEEAARVEAERKLLHARALAAVGQVAASIAHEVGSPLGIILGRAKLLADRPECPEPMRADLETIVTQSERISRIVARMLSTARPSHGIASGSSDVKAVVSELFAFLEPECRRRRIAARIDSCEGPAVAAIEADRLFQALFNLSWNAIEAQPQGGELVLRVETPRGDGRSKHRIRVSVSDAGPGVPDEIAKSIFEPFFTTKADRAGTGLGLDIVSGIVREAGGAVSLGANPGGGARFSITLPEPSEVAS